MRPQVEINSFSKEYDFLSNFYPCKIRHNGQDWPTSEHIYQASKTFDKTDKARIFEAATPGKAKRLGRKVALRSDWENVKEIIMLMIVRLKFSQHPDLAEKLIATGNKLLIEGNYWHDNYWGACSCSKCRSKQKMNRLGEILMKVRCEIKNETT